MANEHARLSIRIDLPAGRFGPGKAALLKAIANTGSIAAAARSLDMSYARAWSLTEAMNASFDTRLVDTFSGGHRRGGASLTNAGERVLRLYEKISEQAERSTLRDLRAIMSLDH
jgi:molybdate transport system regulatory protein